MKRTLLAIAAALVTTGAAPAVASAVSTTPTSTAPTSTASASSTATQQVELGQTSTALTPPVCPAGVSQSNCTIVLTQITALETVTDGTSYPTTVKKPGLLVAFTLGVSALSTDASQVKSDVKFLDTTYGGAPEAQLSVLRRVGLNKKQTWQVAAQSAVVPLEHHLGQVAQFPLTTPLPVVPGEVVALTVPTWAPVLSFDLTASKFAYRKSGTTSCKKVITAQLTIGEQSAYGCSYTGTRVEYTATEIATPNYTS